MQIDGQPIHNTATARKILQQQLKATLTQDITLLVSNAERQHIHHEEGVPTMYFDQLTHINQHLHNIKNDTTTITTPTIKKLESSNTAKTEYPHKIVDTYQKYGTLRAIKGILPKNCRQYIRLTRQKLQQQHDWDKWKQSKWKQLDQYKEQGTFGKP